jgi:hypothetical protein
MVAKAMGTTGTASPPVALGEDGHPRRWAILAVLCAVGVLSGQVGAIGVSVLVALTANDTPLRGFDHVWIVQAGLGLAAAAVLLTLSRHRTADLTAKHSQSKGAR